MFGYKKKRHGRPSGAKIDGELRIMLTNIVTMIFLAYMKSTLLCMIYMQDLRSIELKAC